MLMIRIGIVGAGFWAKMIHIPAFQSIPGYHVVGLTSGSLENARKTARQFGIKKVYADYHELIQDPDVEVVDICAPNLLHAEVTLEALAHGKEVICIKPLATSLKEAQRMVSEAQRRGRKIFYAENVPFIPALARLKSMIDAGVYGKIFRVKACEGIGQLHADWFKDPSQSGGGCIIDMAVHGLSFLQWIAGEFKPVRVVAEAGTFVHPHEVEDTSVILVRFENGMIGQTEDSWSLVGGFDSRFEVFGTKGHAMVDLLYGHPIRSALGKANEGGANALHFHPIEDHFVKDGHLAMMKHFLACIEDGAHCRTTGEDGLRVMELVDAAYRSVNQHSSVSL
jgi:predicted dehydrogenase